MLLRSAIFGICLATMGCGVAEEELYLEDSGKAETQGEQCDSEDLVGDEENEAVFLTPEHSDEGYFMEDTLTVDDYGLQDEEDVDWFEFRLKDKFNGRDPRLTVSLDDLRDQLYRVEVTVTCDEGDSKLRCERRGSGAASIDRPKCMATSGETYDIEVNCGSKSSGTVLVKVYAMKWKPTCNNYSLTIQAD